MFYLVHPDSKHLQEVTFFVASNNGLIQHRNRLDYLPSRSSLITSSADHPKKTESKINVHVSKKESEVCNCKGMVSKHITRKEQILATYANVLDGIGHFPGPHTIFRWILVSHQSKPPVNQSCLFERMLSRRGWTRCYMH